MMLQTISRNEKIEMLALNFTIVLSEALTLNSTIITK